MEWTTSYLTLSASRDVVNTHTHTLWMRKLRSRTLHSFSKLFQKQVTEPGSARRQNATPALWSVCVSDVKGIF